MTRALFAVAVTALLAAACENVPTQSPLASGPLFDRAGTTKDQIRLVISGDIVNSCTGEDIVYSGGAHEVVTQTITSGEEVDYIHVNLDDLHGVTADGVQYVIQEVAKESEDFIFTPPFPNSTTLTVKLKLTSQGSGDNFSLTAVETATFDGTTFTLTIDQKTTCNG